VVAVVVAAVLMVPAAAAEATVTKDVVVAAAEDMVTEAGVKGEVEEVEALKSSRILELSSSSFHRLLMKSMQGTDSFVQLSRRTQSYSRRTSHQDGGRTGQG
jgi:hypothetical protein